MPAGSALFTCDGVSRHFGSLKAVDGVSLIVEEGEVLGIGGPNGAGKTTLFDVVTGLTPVTSGRVFFGDREITELGADEICQAGIARTFQLNAAFDSMTVLENVQVAAHFGRRPRRLPGSVSAGTPAPPRSRRSISSAWRTRPGARWRTCRCWTASC